MSLSPEATARLGEIIASNMGDVFDKPEAFSGALEHSRKTQEASKEYQLPSFVTESARIIRNETEHGAECFTLEPLKTADVREDSHIIYLHGGGFMFDIDECHWHLCLNLMNELKCRITVPLYPLIPLGTYREGFDVAFKAFVRTRKMHPKTKIVLMGDSAGANLCLAVSQLAQQQALSQPALLVLSSPFIDMTGTTEQRVGHVNNDPMISWYGSREIMKLWAPDCDPCAFPPDPFFGPKAGLAPLLVFSGTREVLCAGSREFCEQVNAAGGSATFLPYEDMWHAFLLDANIPECDEARSRVIAAISSL